MNKKLENRGKFITDKGLKKSGFKVPKNYFDGIEQTFFTKLSENNLPKEHGFVISDDYFLSVEKNILQKVTNKETKTISLRTKVIRLIPFLAAASVILFISVLLFKASEITFNDLQSTEIENFLSDNPNINTTILEEALNLSDFENNELLTASLNNNDIIEYLNTVETTSILNEID